MIKHVCNVDMFDTPIFYTWKGAPKSVLLSLVPEILKLLHNRIFFFKET